MTDQPTSPPEQQPDPTTAVPGPPPAYDAQVGVQGGVQPYGAPGGVAAAGQLGQLGQIGKVRSTGTCMLLFIVTLGIYGWFWYFNTHEEMKRHTGEGIGGVLALVLGIFVNIVMVFLSPHEVGRLYERRGERPPVSALTGLWVLLPLAGAIVWFVKTNGALNDYWRSLGAR
jgi:Domain of unknown function (DUF4234)